ncbi:MAG: NADH:flavin oxidoreductase [Flavobacteriales bacterium]|nr:NADH:flavin oxidoreductase [Flavobacteriales bacterium]
MEALFTPFRLGPLTLRNRSLRAAAFEGLCPGHLVSDALIAHHRAYAAGGVGMTTVAYAAVQRSGLSFAHQLWLRPQAVPGLRRLTDAVHAEGAACSIQLGHAGDMASHALAGARPLAPGARPNLYGPSWPRAMRSADIAATVRAFADSVRLAAEAGFDAIELHAGHGYLIGQFLSPWTNRRRDAYGGDLVGRMRFMDEVLDAVLHAARGRLAVLVKVNMSDGFRGGMEQADALQVARRLEAAGADALVLSGGFVSRAPMAILRGAMPVRTLAAGMRHPLMRLFARAFAGHLIPPVPFTENYFLDQARAFRRALRLPLVYVGGLRSAQGVAQVLAEGFELVAFARALLEDPGFVQRLHGPVRSACDTCNHCVAVMYNGPVVCIRHPHR